MGVFLTAACLQHHTDEEVKTDATELLVGLHFQQLGCWPLEVVCPLFRMTTLPIVTIESKRMGARAIICRAVIQFLHSSFYAEEFLAIFFLAGCAIHWLAATYPFFFKYIYI